MLKEKDTKISDQQQHFSSVLLFQGKLGMKTLLPIADSLQKVSENIKCN